MENEELNNIPLDHQENPIIIPIIPNNNIENPIRIENLQNNYTNESENNPTIALTNISNQLNNIRERLNLHEADYNQLNNNLINENIINSTQINNSYNNPINNEPNILNNNNPNNITNNINNNIKLNEIFSEYPFQNNFFVFSSGLAVLLLCWIILFNINQEFTFSNLEREDMFLNYLLINILIAIITWNFYLIFSNFIFKTNSLKKNDTKKYIKLKETLMFSPFWMYCVVKYSVPNYLSTIFDGFFIVFVSIQYKINFIFSIRLYKFFNDKILNISNFHLEENKGFMMTIRLNLLIIALYNFIFLSFMFLFLSQTDYIYKFIILGKVKLYFF